MGKIRAAVCREFNTPLTVEEVELRKPQSGEVEVDLHAVAICHSDISYWQGGFGGSLPAVYGHEAAGIVTAVGDNVVGIKEGDSVCVTLIHACGHCTTCQSGKPTICETPVDNLGSSPIAMGDEPVFKAMATGAFAEKVVVDQSQLCVIPEDMPKDSAALISCGVITGVGAAVFAADIEVGQDVVVIGAGGVGLNAIQGARIAGARRIVAVDMLEDKLEVAKEFGATDTVLAEGKPWSEVKKILGRGADAVLVTVGVAQVYDQAPRYLGWGGKVVMVGMPHGDKVSTYSPLIMANQGQGIVGSKMGDMVIKRDIPWIVDMYQQGRLKLDELISGRWTLDQINDAIEDTKSGAARRNVIMLK